MIPDGEPVAADLDLRASALPGEPDVVVSEGARLRVFERDGPGIGVCLADLLPGASLHHRPTVTEDVLVLEGVLSDDGRPARAGTYLRWRSGQARDLVAVGGCRLVVAARPSRYDGDLHLEPGELRWLPSYTPGLFQIDLCDDGEFRVVLLRFDPGAAIESHVHEGGEELFVVEGALEDEHGHYPAGSWVRQPPGSRHAVVSRPGCVLWTTSGHLAGPARRRRQAHSG